MYKCVFYPVLSGKIWYTSRGCYPNACANGCFIYDLCISGRTCRRKNRPKKSMLIGNAVVVGSFLIIFMLKEHTFLTVLLGISGVGWSLLTTNAYPAVAEMAPKGHTGLYTGYYYVFTFAASIVSPILYGLTVDILRSQAYLFIFGGIMFILGFVFLSKVKQRDIYHRNGIKTRT